MGQIASTLDLIDLPAGDGRPEVACAVLFPEAYLGATLPLCLGLIEDPLAKAATLDTTVQPGLFRSRGFRGPFWLPLIMGRSAGLSALEEGPGSSLEGQEAAGTFCGE